MLKVDLKIRISKLRMILEVTTLDSEQNKHHKDLSQLWIKRDQANNLIIKLSDY